MKRQHGFTALVLAALGSAAVAAPPVTSTFDSDTEGWSAVNGATDFQWVAAGGQSGGFIRGTDTVDGGVWLFLASAAYKGDHSDAYGGTLSYYLRQFTAPDPVLQNFADVKFVGVNGVTIAADVGPDPGTAWTFYSASLLPGLWHLDDINGALASAADIQGVLADVASLHIRGEYSRGRDVDGLDTVVLSAPAIPEPETYALMLAGLGALGAVARRRRG